MGSRLRVPAVPGRLGRGGRRVRGGGRRGVLSVLPPPGCGTRSRSATSCNGIFRCVRVGNQMWYMHDDKYVTLEMWMAWSGVEEPSRVIVQITCWSLLFSYLPLPLVC